MLEFPSLEEPEDAASCELQPTADVIMRHASKNANFFFIPVFSFVFIFVILV